jgi:hypothetical protein
LGDDGGGSGDLTGEAYTGARFVAGMLKIVDGSDEHPG